MYVCMYVNKGILQRSNFLSVPVVNSWNQLPEEVISAKTVNSFKNRHDKHISTNPGRFGPGSFRPGSFGLGRFGQFLGWVVSALVGGSFRPIFEVSHFGPGSFRPKSIETIKV